jgi:hypothetical protein
VAKLIAALASVHLNPIISRHDKEVARTFLPAKPNAKKCHLPFPRFAGKVFWDTVWQKIGLPASPPLLFLFLLRECPLCFGEKVLLKVTLVYLGWQNLSVNVTRL